MYTYIDTVSGNNHILRANTEDETLCSLKSYSEIQQGV